MLARTQRRSGFSLVELLVVLAIIVIVMALGSATTMAVLSSQRSSATTTTCTKLSDALNKQWSAVVDAARREEIIDSLVVPGQPYSLFELSGGNPQRLRVLWIKWRLKQSFPLSFQEGRTSGDPYFIRALPANGLKPRCPEEEAASLLFLALKRKVGGGAGFDPEANLTSNEVGDPGDGLKYAVDAWGNPIFFCRWPTGNTELNPAAAPRSPSNDPTDPTGLLTEPAWVNGDPGSGAPAYGRDFYSRVFHAVKASDSYKIAPVVVSAGRNATLVSGTSLNGSGLTLNTLAVTDQAAAQDNIYSYVLRLGARGD